MSEIQDSAAIIAADMRQLADDIEAGRAIVGQSVWRSYADRVEAIGTGNIAKLRNALELSKVAILVAKEKMDLENPIILEIIDEALAAALRKAAGDQGIYYVEVEDRKELVIRDKPEGGANG